MRRIDTHSVFVPIGLDCSVAHHLRAEGLRSAAFPFDWNVTPVVSAMQLLDSRFEGFLRPEHLVYLPPVKRLLFSEDGLAVAVSNDVITPVVCTMSRILFPHDFSVRGRSDYDAVKAKYDARCGRLFDALDSARSVVFVYNEATLNPWQRQQYAAAGVPEFGSQAPDTGAFSRVVRRIRPGLPFTIQSLDELKASASGEKA